MVEHQPYPNAGPLILVHRKPDVEAEGDAIRQHRMQVGAGARESYAGKWVMTR
jgi:hypothetical protein